MLWQACAAGLAFGYEKTFPLAMDIARYSARIWVNILRFYGVTNSILYMYYLVGKIIICRYLYGYQGVFWIFPKKC